MVSCSLNPVIGKPVTSSPLDLTLPDRTQLFLWTMPPADFSRGDLWIDYPFSKPYNALRDSELATDVRTRIEGYVTRVVGEASSAGIDQSKATWAVTELLVNATQYARLSDTTKIGGLIRLEWRVLRDETGASLALAVSNPCPRLFDPIRYARMNILDFASMEPSNNGHMGTIALLNFLKPHSHLSCIWELPNDEMICVSTEIIHESDPDRPEDFEEIMRPVRVRASKLGENNQPLPYSEDDFYRDVSNGVATKTFSISCVV